MTNSFLAYTILIVLAGNKIWSLVFQKHVSQLNALSQGKVFSGNWFLSYTVNVVNLGSLSMLLVLFIICQIGNGLPCFGMKSAFASWLKRTWIWWFKSISSSHTVVNLSSWCLCFYWCMAEKIALSFFFFLINRNGLKESALMPISVKSRERHRTLLFVLAAVFGSCE